MTWRLLADVAAGGLAAALVLQLRALTRTIYRLDRHIRELERAAGRERVDSDASERG